jgi:thiamine kinase-like enzyme
MYNYHSKTPFLANTERYPTAAERERFLEAYVAHGRGTEREKDKAIRMFEQEIKDWRVVNHAYWCAWGIVMSEDDPELLSIGSEMENQVIQEERPVDEEQGATSNDFDYIAYADQKMRLFWGELASGRMFDDYKDSIEGSKFISG